MKQNSSNSSQTQTNAIEPKYLGVAEAEVMTGLSRWTWRRWAYTGKIASVKVGKRLVIPIAEINRVMSEGMRPALENR